MTSVFTGIDYGSGSITYIEKELVFHKVLFNQLDILREDLLQVSYQHGEYILDVGWYPSFDEKGCFRVVIIHDANWQTPLFDECPTTLDLLIRSIHTAIKYVDMCLGQEKY